MKPCLVCGAMTRASRCPAHRLRNGSTRTWRATRERILARDGGRCRICRAPAQHVDHVVPKVRGGTDEDRNLRALCSECNLKKGAR